MTDLRKAAIELLKSAPDHIQGHWPELDEVCKALAQPEQDQLAHDQITHGMSVTLDGNRIDPTSIYKEPVRDRESDRKRFPDQLFNRWLDESITDAGHTVWDMINDTRDAWAAWETRPFYDTKQEPVAWDIEGNGDPSCMPDDIHTIPLYTAPPSKPEKEPDSAINGVLIDRILELEAELAKADVTLISEGNTEQEPLCWLKETRSIGGGYEQTAWGNTFGFPVFTAPVSKPKEWVSLTQDQTYKVWHSQGSDFMNQDEAMKFARAIEAATKELNHG